MNMIKNRGLKSLKVSGVVISAMVALLSPGLASASSANGTFSLNIDNTALSSVTSGFGVTHYYDETFNNQAINGPASPTGIAYSGGDINFKVNDATVTPSTTPFRIIQPTTLNYSGDPKTSTGQVGIAGSLMTEFSGTYLKFQDLSLSFDSSSSNWIMKTNEPGGGKGFGTRSVFTLTNVQTSTVNDALSLTGDLTFGNSDWANLLFGLDATQKATVIGSLTLTPSAVPVPAAVWLFGSALLGLTGYRRKSALAA